MAILVARTSIFCHFGPQEVFGEPQEASPAPHEALVDPLGGPAGVLGSFLGVPGGPMCGKYTYLQWILMFFWDAWEALGAPRGG